jgi:hypothetical protein
VACLSSPCGWSYSALCAAVGRSALPATRTNFAGEPVVFFIDDAVSVGSAMARPVEVAARLFGSAPFRVGLTSSDRWLVMEPSLKPSLPRRWEAIADSAVSVCSAGARP